MCFRNNSDDTVGRQSAKQQAFFLKKTINLYVTKSLKFAVVSISTKQKVLRCDQTVRSPSRSETREEMNEKGREGENSIRGNQKSEIPNTLTATFYLNIVEGGVF